jgi:hypothetical protein
MGPNARLKPDPEVRTDRTATRDIPGRRWVTGRTGVGVGGPRRPGGYPRHELDLTGLLTSDGEPARILWLHRTDRWYFGDFLRHAAWLVWLREQFPGATVDVASLPAYVALYAGAGYGRLLDSRAVTPADLGGYDLVVAPSARAPQGIEAEAPLMLATWDQGWAICRSGRVSSRGVKTALNYFRVAHPSAVTRQCPLTRPSPIVLLPWEKAEAAADLATVFPGDDPVVVYNPTASNPFTRDTTAAKEVDNRLSTGEHVLLLRHLLDALPDHRFLVASAVKPGDHINAAVLRAVASQVRSPRVAPIPLASYDDMTGLRGFAALLDDVRVCCVVGGGTGTNAHLAAVVGTPSFSLERGADDAMLANWRQPEAFQMGSFRWRNPSVLAGTHTLVGPHRTPQQLERAADAFLIHHQHVHQFPQDGDHEPTHAHRHGPDTGAGAGGCEADTRQNFGSAAGFERHWPTRPALALRHAGDVLDALTPAGRAHFGDFGDEATYLQLPHGRPQPQEAQGPVGATSTHDGDDAHDDEGGACGAGFGVLVAAAAAGGQAGHLAVRLFEDSNLHKLLVRNGAARSEEAGQPDQLLPGDAGLGVLTQPGPALPVESADRSRGEWR